MSNEPRRHTVHVSRCCLGELMNGMAWHPSFPSDGNGQLRNPRPLVLVIGAAGSPRHPWWVPWSRRFACDPMQLFLLKKCISSNSQTPTLTSNPLLQLSLITAVLTSYRISTLSPIALNTLCDSSRLGNRDQLPTYRERLTQYT